MNRNIGDIAVNENLTRGKRNYLIGWHSAIGTADPKVLRSLLLGQLSKKLWVLVFNLIGPFNVSFKQM